MAQEITSLASPIDAMLLMHQAFEAISQRVENLAAEGQSGGDLQAFRTEFDAWVTQLLHHATAEDLYMTGPISDAEPARDNESEHAELAEHGTELVNFIAQGDEAGLSDSVKSAVLGLEDAEHEALARDMQNVADLIKKEIGQEKVTARTRRHLYQRVMALRVLEFDHFENEEAFVLPLVREGFNDRQQLDMVERLLFDGNTENPRWIIGWMASELPPKQRALLLDLEKRLVAGHSLTG